MQIMDLLTITCSLGVDDSQLKMGPFIDVSVTWNGGSCSFVLPSYRGICYYVVPRSGTRDVVINAKTALVAKRFSVIAGALKKSIRLVSVSKRAIKFEQFICVATGPRLSIMRYFEFMRQLERQRGSKELSILLNPEICIGWATRTHPSAPHTTTIAEDMKAAVVVHLYYMDLIDEVAALIKSRRQSFDVIITTSFDNAGWVERIDQMFPRVKIILCENKGRDVRPFLTLLEQGFLDGYDLVCKMHGKKSQHKKTGSQLMGDVWRRRLFMDLLGNQKELDSLLVRFSQDKRLGMVGPKDYRCPGPIVSLERGWGKNRSELVALASRMGISEKDVELDFFAGSMFWVRPEALNPLRVLSLSNDYFDVEAGLIDGGPEHAIERLFSISVKKAGYCIGCVDGLADVNG